MEHFVIMIKNYFGVDVDYSKLKDIFRKLKSKVYKANPQTVCINCPGKEEVTADCCRIDNPPVYFIEFIHIMEYISNNFSQDELKELSYKCYEAFFNDEPTFPCIFLKDKSTCTVYKARPQNCRNYGIVPPDEWSERQKNVAQKRKVAIEDLPMCEQCPNVDIKGKEGKDKDWANLRSNQNKVYSRLIEIEKEIGCAEDNIASGATNINFPMHYLLHLIGPDKLDELTAVREVVKKDILLKQNILSKFRSSLGL